MRFVKLTNRNGRPVWVNPAHVLTLEPYPIYLDGDRVAHQTVIRFAVVGAAVACEGTTDHEPYREHVTESPEEVAGRMLAPLGAPA
jgi:hypothetical protein